MYNIQGAGPVKGQSLGPGPGSTVCLATQHESGGQGGVVYGQPGDFNFSGSQNRPIVFFQQKEMRD